MWTGVPTMLPDIIASVMQKPRSVNFARLSVSNKTFFNFMSLCTRPYTKFIIFRLNITFLIQSRKHNLPDCANTWYLPIHRSQFEFFPTKSIRFWFRNINPCSIYRWSATRLRSFRILHHTSDLWQTLEVWLFFCDRVWSECSKIPWRGRSSAFRPEEPRILRHKDLVRHPSRRMKIPHRIDLDQFLCLVEEYQNAPRIRYDELERLFSQFEEEQI